MKKALIVTFLILVCVVAIGFYRGWFALSSGRQVESNKVDINLTLDADRVKEDAEAVKKKTTELTEELSEKVTERSTEPQHEPTEERPQ